MNNYYEILGVSESSSQDEIKSAYRNLAKKHHPDVNHGKDDSEKEFKKVQEAYDTLSDETKKQRYDFMRKNGYDPSGIGSRSPFSHSGFDPFSDFFRQANQQASMGGQDVGFDLPCRFEDTIHGIKKNVSFKTNHVCKLCEGEGFKKGTSKTTCSFCKGVGQVVNVQNFGGNRVVQIATVCPRCEGKGKSISPDNVCPKCNSGLIDNESSLDIEIPSGISYGATIKLQDKGLYVNPKGKKGDCYIRIVPEKHDLFEMTKNYEIVLLLYISMSDAILGTTVDVPTIDGSTEKLKIPTGTNDGDELVIHNKGLFRKGTNRADMHVIIKIETLQCNEDVEKVVKKLKSLENADNLPKTEALRQKIDKYLKKEKKHGKST